MYEKPTVQLTGEDGNAYSIIAKVGSALEKAGASAKEVAKYYKESTSGDYDNLLRVAMKYVNVL